MDLTILVSLECSFLGFSDWKTNESFKLSLIKLLFEEEFDLSPCALPSFRFLEDFLLEMLLDPNLKSLRDAIQLVERPDSGTASLPLLLEIKLILFYPTLFHSSLQTKVEPFRSIWRAKDIMFKILSPDTSGECETYNSVKKC